MLDQFFLTCYSSNIFNLLTANNQTDLHKLHLGPIVDFLKILDKFEFKCRFVKIKCRFIKFKSRFVKFKGRFVKFHMRG